MTHYYLKVNGHCDIMFIVDDNLSDGRLTYIYNNGRPEVTNAVHGFEEMKSNYLDVAQGSTNTFLMEYCASRANSDTIHRIRDYIYLLYSKLIYFTDQPPGSRPVQTVVPPEAWLECDDCGLNKPDAVKTYDPYAEEINGESIECTLCDQCYQERRWDI